MRQLCSGLTVCVVALVAMSSTPVLAAPGKCEAFFVIDPFCEAGKTIGGKAGEIATAPLRYAAGSAVEMFTSWVADSAQWILGRVMRFIENSTSPSLDAGWFTERYRFMIGLAALVLLPMLLIALIRAVMTQDASQLLRSFFLYLPIAILGTFVAVYLTQALLGVTDSLSAAVADNIAGDTSQIFDSVGATLTKSVGITSPATPSFVIFFGALLLIVGSFFVWLELLIRSAAVTAAVFFLPMILAGLVWPAASRWTKRLIEILVALILSKFVIVAVISLATAALADPGGGGFGTVMGASALMLMAAFSPFALLKLVPMVEGAAVDHLQGMGRRPIDSIRSHHPVNHAASVMRSKVNPQSSSSGLAVAGSAPSQAAGASGNGAATAAAQQAKKAAKAPARPGETGGAPSTSETAPSKAPSTPSIPPSATKRPTRGKD